MRDDGHTKKNDPPSGFRPVRKPFIKRSAIWVLVTILLAALAELQPGPAAQMVPASGIKPIYLHSGSDLSRTRPSGSQPAVYINAGFSATWALTPSLAAALTIDGSALNIPVELYLQSNATAKIRKIAVSLHSSHGQIGTRIRENINTIPVAPASPALFTFDIPVTGNISLAPGELLWLTVDNQTNQAGAAVYVHPASGEERSRMLLNSLTVINVDRVEFYSAAYPVGTPVTAAAAGQKVWVRATVSDPFGSFDISGAILEWISPGNETVFTGPMVQAYPNVGDPPGAIKIYQNELTVPSLGDGIWTAVATAAEGEEGEITHTGMAALDVRTPNLVLIKTVAVHSDPVNGTTNPKAIPGAWMNYTIIASNQGGGSPDADSVQVVDRIPADTALFVDDLGGVDGGPVLFSDGTPASGLTYAYPDDIEFSDQESGDSWSYIPAANPFGVDPDVRRVRLNPKGTLNGRTEAGAPSFTLRLRVRVN